jgi:deazaflavin-dependent oxidoreductase (nitroreductase family)
VSSEGTRVAGGASHKPLLGRRMARFNKQLTNKAMILVADRLPYFGIVTHKGRRSRNVYRTPVNVFPTEDGFRIALTYGRDAEWVKNALAFGAVRLLTRRRERELTDPRLVTDLEHHDVPAPFRVLLRLMRVSQFLEFKAAV